MANPFRGEVSVTFEGRVWTAILDFNAFAEFEDATGGLGAEVLEAILSGTERVKIAHLRQLLRCALLRRQPDVTLVDAGDILSAYPQIVADELRAALPTVPAEGDADKPEK